MNHKIDINNYSNNYNEYGEKVLLESKNALNKAGIANYKFDSEENKSKLFQLVAGVKYTF